MLSWRMTYIGDIWFRKNLSYCLIFGMFQSRKSLLWVVFWSGHSYDLLSIIYYQTQAIQPRTGELPGSVCFQSGAFSWSYSRTRSYWHSIRFRPAVSNSFALQPFCIEGADMNDAWCHRICIGRKLAELSVFTAIATSLATLDIGKALDANGREVTLCYEDSETSNELIRFVRLFFSFLHIAIFSVCNTDICWPWSSLSG